MKIIQCAQKLAHHDQRPNSKTLENPHRHVDRKSDINMEQVAQQWQRDRVKLETISINVQRYSQNHAQNCIFGPPYVRIARNVSGSFERFNA